MSSKARRGQKSEPGARVLVRALRGSYPNGRRKRTNKDEDRRVFPRVCMDLRVAIIGSGGSPVTARMLDLSRAGLKLGLTKDAALGVFRDGAIRPGDVVEAQFRLSAEDVIKAKCRVVWSAKMDDDEYHVGCEFVRFHKQGYERIEKYLMECLAYPTV